MNKCAITPSGYIFKIGPPGHNKALLGDDAPISYSNASVSSLKQSSNSPASEQGGRNNCLSQALKRKLPLNQLPAIKCPNDWQLTTECRKSSEKAIRLSKNPSRTPALEAESCVSERPPTKPPTPPSRVIGKSNSKSLIAEINELDVATYSLSANRYKALCGTALCYVMNPANGSMVQVRALLDSGANLSLLNNDVARAIGLSGDEVSLCMNVAGGGKVVSKEKEVAFQLLSKNKSFVSAPMVAFTTRSVGNAFPAIDFRPSKYTHLKDLELADKFPSPGVRPFQLLVAEPYFSTLELNEQRLPRHPALPMAKLTAESTGRDCGRACRLSVVFWYPSGLVSLRRGGPKKGFLILVEIQDRYKRNRIY